MTYEEMTTRILREVVIEELIEYLPKIKEMIQENRNFDSIHEEIHDWWADYLIADETEIALDKILEVLK